MRRVVIAVLNVLVAATLAGAPAWAADDPELPVRAVDAAYEAGKAALKARRLDEARAAFERALVLAETPEETWRALLGLALGHELAGDALRAAVDYRRFLARSATSQLAAGPEWGPRRIEAAASVERLEKTLAITHATIAVTVTPEAARVTVAPEVPHACAASPCTLLVAPGAYRVRVTADGREPLERTIDAVAGRVHTIDGALPLPAPPIDTPPPVVVVTPPPRARVWPDAATWTIVGGGAALATGAVLTALAAGDHGHLEDLSGRPASDEVLRDYDATRTRMEDRQAASWVLYTIGGVAVAAGIVWGLIGAEAPPADAATPLTWRF